MTGTGQGKRPAQNDNLSVGGHVVPTILTEFCPMRDGPVLCSPEHIGNRPPWAFVGRSGRLVGSLAALGLLVPALIVGGASCAAWAAEGDPFSLPEDQAAAPTFATSGSRAITAEEVRSVSAGNLYEVVQRLRPLWLRTRALRSYRVRSEIMVIQNRMYFGPLESLRELTLANVWSISYMDGAAATAAFTYPGVQPHIDGAIVVEFGSGPVR